MVGIISYHSTHSNDSFAHPFYSTKGWKHTREAVLNRDNHLCQDCLKHGFITAAEDVHHIIKLTPDNINDANVTLNCDNLVSLCRDCHAKRHREVGRYRIDEDGNMII